MPNEKACRMCRFITLGGDSCPSCGSADLTENWSGFAVIIDPEKSELAKLLDVKMAGKYAIRIK